MFDLSKLKPLPIQPEELEIFSPEGKPSLLEWMEGEYKLSKKVHGLSDRWRKEYGPFWLPIIECLADTTTREVWVSACRQSGKSTVSTGFIGYTVDCDPAPTAIVLPRDKDASERVETIIKPMFESSPRLLRHIGGNIRNINIGKLTMFDHMVFYLLYATVVAELSGKTLCRLLLDEVGRWVEVIGHEGDPVNIARKTLRTFKGRSKLYGPSTPVLKDDLFDRNYKRGDQCEWWLPCEICGRMQYLTWGNVEIEKDGLGVFYASDFYQHGRHAWYVCPFCKERWSESARWAGVCRGRYVPHDCTIDDNGELTGKIRPRTIRSFHIPALILHPAIITMSDLAAEWVEAEKDWQAGRREGRQVFINAEMAEVWEVKEKEPEESKLRPHIGGAERGIVPEGVQILTAGVDVQIDHCWIAIVGWGYQFEGWLIYAGRLETGSTDRVENYKIVRDYLNSSWPLASSDDLKMRLKMAAIDSRYQTDVVNEVCRRWVETPVFPVMGWPEFRMAGRMYRRIRLTENMNRYDVNVDPFKDAVYRQLFEADSPGPGYIHIYRDIVTEYLKHFLNEQKVSMKVGNKDFLTWQLTDTHKPNHLWDCLVICRFLAELAGVPSLQSPEDIANRKNEKPIGKAVGQKPIRTKY